MSTKEQTPIQAPIPQTPTEAEHGWRLNRTATAAATVALAVLTQTPKLKSIEVPDPFGGETPSTQVTPGANTDPTSRTTTETGRADKLTVTEQVDSAGELWARLFSADKDAGKLRGDKELSKVRERIEDIRADGFNITKVTLEGHSSDEDDSVNAVGQRTAGLREDSLKNRQLANKRARVYRGELTKDMEARGEDVPALEISSPVEDMLTKGEKARVGHLAEQFGFPATVDMIEAYNRGEAVPKEVKQYLNHVLAQERKVVVTIDAEKVDSGVFGEIRTEDIPGSHTPGQESTGESKKDTITLVLPLFLFLPIMTKRKKLVMPPASSGIRIGGPGPGDGGQEGEIPIKEQEPPVRPVAKVKKDAAFKGKESLPDGHQTVATLRKQPRPHNMHGHRGANHHLARSRGGDRRGRR